MALQLNSVILQFLWNNSFAFAVSAFLVVAATVWIVLNFTGSRGRQKTVLETRGGHSHRRRSHSYDRRQEVVKGSRAVFGVGQAVKDNFQTR